MIDATAGHGVAMVWARADVVEAKAQLKIYLKAALRLADEAEVRVFFHDNVLGGSFRCTPTASSSIMTGSPTGLTAR